MKQKESKDKGLTLNKVSKWYAKWYAKLFWWFVAIASIGIMFSVLIPYLAKH